MIELFLIVSVQAAYFDSQDSLSLEDKSGESITFELSQFTYFENFQTNQTVEGHVCYARTMNDYIHQCFDITSDSWNILVTDFDFRLTNQILRLRDELD